MFVPKMTIGAVLSSKARFNDIVEINARARRNGCGYQDRLNGHPPESGDADYFKGYCEAICDEIDADARRDASPGRADWWGLAD
jgi:hypothetical protein